MKIHNEELTRIATYRLDGPVDRIGATLLRPSVTPGQEGTVTELEGKLRVGELEMGNSSALEAAIQMVSAQRQFETSMQAIDTYKKIGDRSNELGRIK